MKDFINKGRKIIAYGFNYMNHAKELSDAVPKAPFFFLKPTSSYLANKGSIEVPKGCVVHYEIELGVVIGKDGRDIPASKAEDYVAGYALAIDMTARNMQEDVRAKGLPWSAAKGFDTFTPIGEFIPKANLIDPHKARIWLKVNGQTKQDDSTEDMVYKIPQLIEHASSIMRLEAGDLILTGTPMGIGPVVPGDTITAGLESEGNELSNLSFPVIERSGSYVYSAP